MNEEINKSNDMIKGLSSLFIGSALLGMSAIFVRYSDSSPSLVAFYRAFLALPFLYLWVLIEGRSINRFYPDTQNNYRPHQEITHFLMKVETHNHPTAISPFAGAATGSGGEIRDEGATGRGSKPKAGLAGFSVSNLN